MTEDINKILGLKYSRLILEGLENEPSGLSFRYIDVRIVGEKGSPASANSTLKKMISIGWVENKKDGYFITETGRRALIYARQSDSLSSQAIEDA